MRGWSVPVVLACLALACGRTEAEVAARCRRQAQQQKAPAGISFCRMRAEVDVAVRGAEAIRDRGTRQAAMIQFYGPPLPQASWFVGMQLIEPVEMGPGRTYRLGFQLAAGSYRGPGSYRIDPPRQGAAARPDVFVDVVRAAERRAVQYNGIERPCRLKVRALALEGSLVCPQLASQQGGKVSLTLRWRAVA